MLKLHIMELEHKVQSLMQDISIANATITMRNTEIEVLQNNSRELEELRELKAVCYRHACITYFVSYRYHIRICNEDF